MDADPMRAKARRRVSALSNASRELGSGLHRAAEKSM
jgi:hypothetical protein